MEPSLIISFYNLDTDDGNDDSATVRGLVVTTHTGERYALKCNDLGLVVTAADGSNLDVVARPTSCSVALKVIK